MPANIFFSNGDKIVVSLTADEVAGGLNAGGGLPVPFDAPAPVGDELKRVYVNPAHVARFEDVHSSGYEKRGAALS